MQNNLFKFLSFKNISENWHFIGLLQITAGIMGYFFGFFNDVDIWEYLWICPLVAIITGILLLFKNRFGISSAIVWIICAPLLSFFYDIKRVFDLWHIHHLISIIVLILILFNLKKIWNPKGFAFGLTSYYAYLMISSYLTSGKINLFYEWFGYGKIILFMGIFFAISSVIIIFWDKSENNKIIKQ